MQPTCNSIRSNCSLQLYRTKHISAAERIHHIHVAKRIEYITYVAEKRQRQHQLFLKLTDTDSKTYITVSVRMR